MKSFYTKLRARNQITLAPEIVKSLHLEEGDELEFTIVDGKLIGTPKMTINKDQAWYFTPEWQKGEEEAEEHLKKLLKPGSKESKKFASIEEALDDLDL
jgi:antitoxin MazE